MNLRTRTVTLTIAMALGLTAFASPHSESSAVVGSGNRFVRVEAVSDGVARIWYSDSRAFQRKLSLAMEAAPKSRLGLGRTDSNGLVTLTTNRLVVQIDSRTLEATVFDLKTKARIAGPFRYRKKEGGKWGLTEQISPEEHLTGLGQDNRNQGKLNRRGTVRTLWAGQQIRSGDVTAEYPVPFMLSSGPQGHGYGVFIDDVQRLRYDLGKSSKNEIEIDADGGDADFYVIDGPTPKAAITRYTGLTGRPSLPPLWAMGYIQSRCVFYNWGDVDAAYAGLRSRGYPVDALVIDYQWHNVLCDFQFADRWTVNGVSPDQRIADYAKKNVKIVLYASPMVKKEASTYKSGWDAGVFATDGKGNPIQTGYYGGDLLDFTAPNMNRWLWPQLEPHQKAGVEGWFLDLTEPEGEPPQTVYKGGTSPEIHNGYSILATRSFTGALLKDHPNVRPWVLTRTGGAGLQREHATVWTGDINSDYATLAAHPAEMLNSGMSGLNWWTCDTGGFLTGYYKNDRYGAHARLFERWIQFSTFSPITRTHKAGLCMPYEFGPATEQGTKHYLNLRYRLLPYIYSHAVEASQTGVPIVRSMGLEFPDDPGSVAAHGDQYMFGSNLLVAPVTGEGISKRPVYFPPGKWIDWDTGVEYTGGRTWVVDSPQNRIPVAVRPGAIVPMAPEMANTTVGKWDPLTVEVYPSGTSTFTMAQDDGKTFDYEKGRRTTTVFKSFEKESGLSFEIKESNRLFVPKRYLLRFHLDRAPLDTKGWDAKARVLTIPVDEAGKTDHTITVRLSSKKLSARPAPLLLADKAVEGAISPGAPTPHFFPGPVLPANLLAVNYDNGGEGVAYHRAVQTQSVLYRTDNVGIVYAKNAGGYAVSGLAKDDWLRYSMDSGNGGYYDLVVHASGEGAFRLLSADRNVIPTLVLPKGSEEVVVSNVYLNPGSDSLLLYVERPGFTLSSLEFRRAANPPSFVESKWAAHTGQVVETKDGLGNVGQLAGSVTLGVHAMEGGTHTIRFHYSNGSKDLTFHLSVNGGEPVDVKFPHSDSPKDLDVTLPLVTGANKIELRWTTQTYDSMNLGRVEVLRA